MERTKEEELNIVLKNFDKVKAERDRYQKENEDLKKELAQQKALYKNMLDRFSGNHVEDWEHKYRDLSARYKQKMDDRSRVMNENQKMKNMIDSIRGVFCNAHNRLDSLCEELSISHRGEVCLNQGTEEKPKEVVTAPVQVATTLKEFQQQQFIKYVREMVSIYKKTGGLGGIALNANKYGVTGLSKIQFFKFDLHEEPLTDERILQVYDRIKKKGL